MSNCICLRARSISWLRPTSPVQVLRSKRSWDSRCGWRRGDRITGRDILDFALIAEREPNVLMPARAFMTRHAAEVFLQLDVRYDQLKQQFDAVDVLNYHPSFDQACQILRQTLGAMLAAPSP